MLEIGAPTRRNAGWGDPVTHIQRASFGWASKFVGRGLLDRLRAVKRERCADGGDPGPQITSKSLPRSYRTTPRL